MQIVSNTAPHLLFPHRMSLPSHGPAPCDDADGHLVTAGGRVLTVVGAGPDVATARAVAYEAVEHVHVPGGQLRLDVAARG